MRFRKANLYQVSPVALVTLSACGGDTTLPVVNSKTVSGNVVNGPLSNALVFLDLNSVEY